MELLDLVANLDTKWHHFYWLQIWPPYGTNCIGSNLTTRCHHLHWLPIWPLDGATRISYKLSHQMAPLAKVPNLTIRWRQLHKLKICPPDGATCISSIFYHQKAPLALVANLATRLLVTCITWLPWIALLELSVSIDLVSSSTRVTSVKSATTLSEKVRDNRTHRSDQGYLGPIKRGLDCSFRHWIEWDWVGYLAETYLILLLLLRGFKCYDVQRVLLLLESFKC